MERFHKWRQTCREVSLASAEMTTQKTIVSGKLLSSAVSVLVELLKNTYDFEIMLNRTGRAWNLTYYMVKYLAIRRQ